MIDRCDEWIISFLCLSLFHNGLDGDGLADDQVKGLIDRLKIERKRRAGDDTVLHQYPNGLSCKLMTTLRPPTDCWTHGTD